MRSIRDIFRSHAVFDAEGRHVNGTDKQSNHDYGDAYESLFTDGVVVGTWAKCWSLRESVKLVMEVGVADGSCLLAWREVFPNATIVGLDVHHSDKARGDRIEFHLGDATQFDACARAASGRLFDLIVDDGTHRIGDILLTLFWLWPAVRPGGLYVIEDTNLWNPNFRALLPTTEIVETRGPSGGIEPLVVLRKPR